MEVLWRRVWVLACGCLRGVFMNLVRVVRFPFDPLSLMFSTPGRSGGQVRQRALLDVHDPDLRGSRPVA